MLTIDYKEGVLGSPYLQIGALGKEANESQRHFYPLPFLFNLCLLYMSPEIFGPIYFLVFDWSMVLPFEVFWMNLLLKGIHSDSPIISSYRKNNHVVDLE